MCYGSRGSSGFVFLGSCYFGPSAHVYTCRAYYITARVTKSGLTPGRDVLHLGQILDSLMAGYYSFFLNSYLTLALMPPCLFPINYYSTKIREFKQELAPIDLLSLHHEPLRYFPTPSRSQSYFPIPLSSTLLSTLLSPHNILIINLKPPQKY